MNLVVNESIVITDMTSQYMYSHLMQIYTTEQGFDKGKHWYLNSERQIQI